MSEEMTFSEKLGRNLKLESFGILRPDIETGVLLGVKSNGTKTKNLQDCCFRFIQLRKENKVTEEVKEKTEKIRERIKERIKFLTNDLKEDENQFAKEGTYKENYSKLKAKYYEILSWRRALETLSEKEFKPLDARKAIQTKVDDVKRWNNFLNEAGAKK